MTSATHIARARAPVADDRGALPPAGRLGAPVDTSPDGVLAYTSDAAHVPGGHAEAVAWPRTEAEVAALLASHPRVLAVGAQSSLTGGATPMGGLVLSTARMTAIRLEDDRVVAGPGVTLAALDVALAAAGRWYPPAPTFLGATVGGVIATNAAGAATFKYGTTRDWVQAVTVVLPGGRDVLDLRRGDVRAHRDGYFELELRDRRVRLEVPPYRLPDVPKISAGYHAAPAMDLVDLFVGAEGTLGVITSATLRVAPRRPAVALALVTCPSLAAGLRVVAELRARSQAAWRGASPSGLDACAIEHMDRRSLTLLREDGVDRICDVGIPADSALALLITLELPPDLTAAAAYGDIAGALDAGAPETALTSFCRLLAGEGLLDRTEIALPGDRRQSAMLAFREAVPAAVNQRVALAQRTVDATIEKVAADVIVPFDRLPALFDAFEAEFGRRRLDGAVWGHISDGNLHPNVIPRTAAELAEGKAAVLSFGRTAIALGGAPCAEHGVGRNPIKQQLVRELVGAEGIDAMRRLKRALDPTASLAPGVLGLDAPADAIG